MQELVERYGMPTLEEHINDLIDYAERITRATIKAIPDGYYCFTDYLDSDGIEDQPVKISVSITVYGSDMTVNFNGSSPQVRGNVNTVAAVAESATYYVVRCLVPSEAPINYGTFTPVTVIAPREQ
jgi:N-methylhydantoinase B